ncbi:M23 family metallopeptidase [Winogradskyella ursingii]|uniref:M23 family metallopeptidase n=1 Tax=Winogradskyella ursingii TaxID=2686079 RepID=UPI001FE38CD3|nr:M23 family metallopeptidase [Winogradskyella ursingii]
MMKHLLFFLIFMCSGTIAFAQVDTEIKVIKIKNPHTLHKNIMVKEVEIPLVAKNKPIEITDIKSEYWDHTQFNPYRGSKVEFPIQLKFYDSLYSSPIPRKKVITSRYGWRKGKAHQGIDIDLVTGDSVVSMLDGIVRFARYSSGHGNTVIVRHYNSLETAYAHLSKYAVKENDTIKKGQLLGYGGATGNARGSHLHLVVSYKGEYIHPEYIFDFSENNTIRGQNVWLTKKWTRANYHNSKQLSDLNLLQSEEDALASLADLQQIYIVKPGDTLSRISKRNRIPIEAICSANAIDRNATLKIGQQLVLEL